MMTVAECKELKVAELKKLTALEKIVAILEELRAEDDEAADWVLEKINE